MNWIIVLLLAGVAVAVLEVFLPSGGVLGVASALLILGAILVVGFEYGAAIGLACLAVALITFPIVAVFFIRWWPNTRMGSRFLAHVPSEEEVRPDTPELVRLRELVGKVGRARSVMLPAGAVEVEGRVINAQSEGLPIEEGTLVRVVEVRGSRVIVRPADELPATASSAEPDLAQPLDALGMDPLEDLT